MFVQDLYSPSLCVVAAICMGRAKVIHTMSRVRDLKLSSNLSMVFVYAIESVLFQTCPF